MTLCRKRVLILEDDMLNDIIFDIIQQRMVKEVLKDHGY